METGAIEVELMRIADAEPAEARVSDDPPRPDSPDPDRREAHTTDGSDVG